MPTLPKHKAAFVYLLLPLLTGWLWLSSIAHAEAHEYGDIYLTGNRMCKACRWESVDGQHLRLTNQAGHRIVVPASEVLGMDRHPLWRKLIHQSLVGIGLPGKVIVPGAFEDGWDFACKYCDP